MPQYAATLGDTITPPNIDRMIELHTHHTRDWNTRQINEVTRHTKGTQQEMTPPNIDTPTPSEIEIEGKYDEVERQSTTLTPPAIDSCMRERTPPHIDST